MKANAFVSTTLSALPLLGMMGKVGCLPMPMKHGEMTKKPGSQHPLLELQGQLANNLHTPGSHPLSLSTSHPILSNEGVQKVRTGQEEVAFVDQDVQKTTERKAVMVPKPPKAIKKIRPLSSIGKSRFAPSSQKQTVSTIDSRTHIPIEEHERIVAEKDAEISSRDAFHATIFNQHIHSRQKEAQWKEIAMDKSKHNHDLQTKLDALTNEKTSLEQQHQRLQSTHEALASYTHSLKKAKSTHLLEQHSNVYNEHQALRKKYEPLVEAHDQLQKEHQALQIKHREMHLNLQDQMYQNQALKKAYEDMTGHPNRHMLQSEHSQFARVDAHVDPSTALHHTPRYEFPKPQHHHATFPVTSQQEF